MFFVVGASGSGKSACLPLLKSVLPEYDIHDFDAIGVPEDANKQWRQEATEKWLKRYIKNNTAQKGVLIGQMVLGEIMACPSIHTYQDIHVCLLHSDEITRIERLKKRATYGVSQDTLNWAAWLKLHHHSPQWAQHVITDDASSRMDFSRWHNQTAWQDVSSLQTIDTSELTIKDVADVLIKWVKTRGG